MYIKVVKSLIIEYLSKTFKIVLQTINKKRVVMFQALINTITLFETDLNDMETVVRKTIDIKKY